MQLSASGPTNDNIVFITFSGQILDEIEKAVIGKRRPLEIILTAILVWVETKGAARELLIQVIEPRVEHDFRAQV